MTINVFQSTAQTVGLWFADSGDGKTGKTSLTVALSEQKYGDTSFTSISPTVTEIGFGHYVAVLTTTHDNTVGLISLRGTATGADPCDAPNIIDVVAYDKTSATRGTAGTAIPAVASGSAGAIPTTGTGANQISVDGSGNAKADVNKWLAGTIPAVNVTGVPIVDNKYLLGTVYATPGTAGVPSVDAIRWATKTIPAANVDGVPLTDQKYSLGTILATPTVAGIPKAEASGGSIASVSGAVGSVTGAVGSVTGAVGSVTGNVGGNVVGSTGSVTGAVGSVTGAVGSVTGNVGGNVVGTVASVVGAVGSVAGNVSGSVASVVGAVGSVTGNVGGSVASVASGGITVASLAADLLAVLTVRRGTAQSASSSMVQLDAGASSIDSFYKNTKLFIASGTGAGQTRGYSSYSGTSKDYGIDSPWDTTPDNTSVFILYSNIGGDISTLATATALASVQADTDNIQTRLPAALVSGRMDSSVGALAANVITAASVASDALTAIATNVWSTLIEGSHDAASLMRGLARVAFGKVSGMSTNTPAFRDLADTKTSISGTITADGRTSVSLDLT